MLSDDAFAGFVQARGPALLRTACFLSGSSHDGEDILQQALVNSYACLRRIKEPDALESYVRTTMVRAAISSSRQPWRRRERSTAAPPATPQASEEAASDSRSELWPLLQRLSARQRTVVVLRYYEDLSEADIAEQLGCSTGSVKRHAARGLDHLRRRLGEQAITVQEEIS